MIKFALRLFTTTNIFDIIHTKQKEACSTMWWNSMTLLQQVMFIIACASTEIGRASCRERVFGLV